MDDTRFFVTESGTFKRIHRAGCRYARHHYAWADRFAGDEVELLAQLMWTGSVMWHLGCKTCCPGLDSGIREAQAVHVRNVVLQHLQTDADSWSATTVDCG